MKNEFPVLNYPGSKRNLLEFIDDNIATLIPKDKALFDIFAGSGAISYFYKNKFQIYSNDAEKYSALILEALLNFKALESKEEIFEEILEKYESNFKKSLERIGLWIEKEDVAIEQSDFFSLEDLYNRFPNIWKSSKDELNLLKEKNIRENVFTLFSSYYSGSYFGIRQAIEIDSLRFAIEHFNPEVKSMLMASLFYAVKETSFSKDGHLAQPLDLKKNVSKLFNKRSISVKDKFFDKALDFYSDDFIVSQYENKIFNLPFEKLIKQEEIFENVGFIYADPPYTDMQYSRYFHLLNTLINYDYPPLTIYRGHISKGLYTDNRYQSPLSQRSKALSYQIELFKLCKSKNIGLGFSFAYPQNPEKQATDRYVLDIFELIEEGKKIFGNNFYVKSKDYTHSNNRNSSTKKVLEYLLIYNP